MYFNMYESVDETEYFLKFLLTRRSLKLVENVSNQFDHQYYLMSLLIIFKCLYIG